MKRYLEYITEQISNIDILTSSITKLEFIDNALPIKCSDIIKAFEENLDKIVMYYHNHTDELYFIYNQKIADLNYEPEYKYNSIRDIIETLARVNHIDTRILYDMDELKFYYLPEGIDYSNIEKIKACTIIDLNEEELNNKMIELASKKFLQDPKYFDLIFGKRLMERQPIKETIGRIDPGYFRAKEWGLI